MRAFVGSRCLFVMCKPGISTMSAQEPSSLLNLPLVAMWFQNFTILSAANFLSHDLYQNQGCGNTMHDLSDLVPFHSGQVENFYLLVPGQVQMY